MTRLYELTYLISPDSPKESLKEISQRINSFIAQENGVLEQEIEATKEKLAYPIKKKNEAFLTTLIIQLNPDSLEKLEKNLREEGQILRYIILTARKPKQIKKRVPKKYLERDLFLEPRTSPAFSGTVRGREKVSKPTIKLPETQKVELKEIDKKIEEILNE